MLMSVMKRQTCVVGEGLEAASVTLKLNEDEKKFENCVELSINTTMKMTLSSRMCRTMHKYFICQMNGRLPLTTITHDP